MRASICAVGIALVLAGCTWFPNIGVYKLDVNQGNYITQDQVEKLKVGQTRAQVRSALGTGGNCSIPPGESLYHRGWHSCAGHRPRTGWAAGRPR